MPIVLSPTLTLRQGESEKDGLIMIGLPGGLVLGALFLENNERSTGGEIKYS